MRITYDGLINPRNNITLTGVPNILSIYSDDITGNRALLSIRIADLSNINLSTTYKITVNGVTITSTTGTPGIRLFYISNTNTDAVKNSVAASIAKALRSTNLINYDIYQKSDAGVLESIVIIEAKEVGSAYDLKFDTTLSSAISYSLITGKTTDEFANGVINVDVYSLNDYITTLSKSYYKEKIDFNLSSILTSISRYDFLTPYKLIVSYSNNNNIQMLTLFNNLYTAVGYMTNQGNKIIPLIGTKLAQNVNRGFLEGINNNTILYVFNSTIPISLYSSDPNIVLEVNYLDSSKTVFRTITVPMTINNYYGFKEVVLESEFFNKSYYIDIVIPDVGTIRYNVIKPLDAQTRCQRVYYHNSYGGVSFFDFTGEITENHKVDNDIYTKNVYDYYRDSSMEEAKIYDKKTAITVTMKSHLMEKNAIWQFNDLLSSYDVWTVVNGVLYKIIVTDCKVDQVETGVWEATVNYTYSLI